MLLPNQLKNFSFQSAGRGVYRAQDVDEFQNRVYAAYSELYSENAVLKKKFASLTALVDEYNEGKNSIANAIIKSQAISDKMIEEAKKQAEDLLSQAKAQAEEIINDSKQRADAYTSEKTSTADAYLSRAETELERVKKEAEAFASEYTDLVNRNADQIIAKANEQASTIVSAAYADAKLAREKCDEIISEAREELVRIQKEVSLFKAQTEKMIAAVVPALEKIEIPDELHIDLPEDTQETVPADAEFSSDRLPPEHFEYRPEEPEASDEPEAEAVEPFDEDADGQKNEEVEEFAAEEQPGFDTAGDLDSYFSSILNSLNGQSDTSDETDDETKDSSVDTDENTGDGDISFSGSKGYNGNNTSFSSPSHAGFVITDFDDEEN